MASFEETKGEIAEKYAAAAQTQNHRLFREAMKDHWQILREEDGPSDDLTQALKTSGRRILGKEITARTVDELVDLVSNVRQDMTESQRLSVFMEELLSVKEQVGPDIQPGRQAATAIRASSFGRPRSRSSGIDYRADDFDYVDVDFTPNRSISAAAQGIIAVVVLALILGGVLYLLNQLKDRRNGSRADEEPCSWFHVPCSCRCYDAANSSIGAAP
jgi:hypothetical protein